MRWRVFCCGWKIVSHLFSWVCETSEPGSVAVRFFRARLRRSGLGAVGFGFAAVRLRFERGDGAGASGGAAGAGDQELCSRRFGPVTVLIAADVEARGANDYVGGLDGAGVGGLEEVFKDASDFAFASLEEAGVVSVAMDGDAIGEIVVARNSAGTAPADEVGFDGVAIGMRADGAAAGVAGEIGRHRGIGGGGGGWGRLFRQ